jgi:hypothetical protein
VKTCPRSATALYDERQSAATKFDVLNCHSPSLPAATAVRSNQR